MANQEATTSRGPPAKKANIKKKSANELREVSSGLTPQENIKEKCPKCQTEVSAIKVSTNSRAVLFLCPSCGGRRSKILTKDGFKNEKEKFNYRYAPTTLYGKTYAAEAKPINSPDSNY